MKRQISIGAVGDILTKTIVKDFVNEKYNTTFDITHFNIDNHSQLFLSNNSFDFVISHLTPSYSSTIEISQQWIDDYKQYIDRVISYIRKYNSFVILNTIPYSRKGFSSLGNLKEIDQINKINQFLINIAIKEPNISLINLENLITINGYKSSINLKNELVMRMPYTKVMVNEINLEYRKLIYQRLFPRKKVIIVDADNTLWNGIIGEDGIEGINVGNNYPGSIFFYFQHILKYASASGIILALVSKNNLEDIKLAFENIKMPLKIDDFTCIEVNWKSKSDNISKIAIDLNLGLDSMIFVDDSLYELEQVKTSLPEIRCLQFDYKDINKSLTLLQDQVDLTIWDPQEDDLKKKKQYKEHFIRIKERENSSSLEEYLNSLDIKIYYGINRKEKLTRIAQLTNKTNQFNLTTKRYTEKEIEDFMNTGYVYDFSVVDRHGDLGIVGLCIVLNENIDTFLLSCRALGRYIENDLINFIASNHNKKELKATYIPSKRNKVAKDFLLQNNFYLENYANGEFLYKLQKGIKNTFKYKLIKN